MSLLVALLLLCQLALAGNLCYWPNGQQSGDVPCNATAPASPCCANIDQCLTNGLCLFAGSDASKLPTPNFGIDYGRGSCTDPTWSSPSCPQMCTLNQDSAYNRSAYDFRSNWVHIYECNTTGYAKDASYCCESAAESTRCCRTATALFAEPAASIGAFTGVARAVATTPSSIAASTTALQTSLTGTASSAGSQTLSATSSATSGAAASPTQEPGSSGTNAVAIGAGVGGAVGGVALLGLVGFLLYKHHRRAVRRAAVESRREGYQEATMAYQHTSSSYAQSRGGTTI